MNKSLVGLSAIVFASMLASGCNDSKEASSTKALIQSPSDSLDSVLRGRYPQTEAVLNGFGMRILSRSVHNTFTVRFKVDLGDNSSLRRNAVFDSLALAIMAADVSDSRNDPIEFWDSIRNVRARFRKIQGLIPGVHREDSGGFFLPPPQFAPANGASRAKLSFWRILEKAQKGRKDIDVRCGGAFDANGSLFYILESFSTDDGPLSAHRPSYVAIDARTGSEWFPPDGQLPSYSPADPLVSGTGRTFLHFGPDTFSGNWHTVMSVCPQDEESPMIWQHRPASHRLQRLDLDIPSLDLEIDLDSTGFQGRMLEMAAEVEPDSTGWGYLLAISRESDGVWIYRTGEEHLFGERARLPETFQTSNGFRFVRIPNEQSAVAAFFIGAQRGAIKLPDLEWTRSPSLPALPVMTDSVTETDDSVVNQTP